LHAGTARRYGFDDQSGDHHPLLEAEMKKLKLELEKLEVESFDAVETMGAGGTVEAQGYPYSDPEYIGTCGCGGSRLCTAGETCPYTCYIQETCEPGVCY